MEKETVVQKAEYIVEPHASKMGLNIVDIEYLQDGAYMFMRIYIEKEDGDISLEECATLSNAIEDKVGELVPDKFFLEVSSPGLERPLKKEKDFERFVGSKVKLILKHKIEDNRNYTGILQSFSNSTIVLVVEGTELEIPYEEVKKANLVFEFEDF